MFIKIMLFVNIIANKIVQQGCKFFFSLYEIQCTENEWFFLEDFDEA